MRKQRVAKPSRCEKCAGNGRQLVRIGTSAAWVTCETCLGTGTKEQG